MTEAAALLLGSHDFTSMAATDPERSLRDPEQARAQREPDDDSLSSRPVKINPVKTITLAEWSRRPVPGHEDLLIFRITASGFLHHMVRNIVGTLVEIGRGSLEPAHLKRILDARDRTAAGPTAPARGLYLVEVVYDSVTTDDSATTETCGCPVQDDIVGMGGVNDLQHPREAAR
jgi:tRNA pseudouridine38-40 synthase